ncbi:MAG: FadR family transcriptional regulator [Proteobacteria bacterium]|nr:FadR family transcriptional regulator [Pseudomonadota bacterium]
MVDQLRAVLERQIDEGRLKPGDRLAPERELALQFGASRNVVRTALSELHKTGKITRHVGRGTLVTSVGAPKGGVEGLRLSEVSPAELLEFRLASEPGLADAIVLHASERDLQTIMECVERGDAAKKWEEWEQWDRAFHQSLVAATHNKLSVALYGVVIAVRHKAPWLKVDKGSIDPDKWRQYQVEHRQIADALLARDANAATEAIRSHLLKVRAKMLGH